MEKAAKYSKLLEGGRCQLVVVGIETGGRWSSEAADFVEMIAQAKAREAPQVLQWSVHLSWRRRWMRMLSLSCAPRSRLAWSPMWTLGPVHTVLYRIWSTCLGRPDLT